MDPNPHEQLAAQCAVLNGMLQGRAATFEALLAGDEPALLAAHTPFDGVRAERAPGAARLLILGGGRVLWEGEGRLALARDGEELLVELAGAPALRVAFEPEARARRARPPLRERAVGEAA